MDKGPFKLLETCKILKCVDIWTCLILYSVANFVVSAPLSFSNKKKKKGREQLEAARFSRLKFSEFK